jgi:hypothetical protein
MKKYKEHIYRYMTTPSTKVIGEGTYGCVLKPSLPCDNKTAQISYKNKLSKLMLSSAALKEVEEYAIISNVDKNAQYYTGKPTRCKMKETIDSIKAIENCKLIKKNFKNKTVKQIIADTDLLIIGDGGDDLEKWVKKVVKSKDVGKRVAEFWNEMPRLFRGLKVFKSYNLVHHDLKPQNVVFHTETKRANFIDFGLMRSIKSEAAKCREVASCKGSSHWNYPTEVVFMNKKEYSILAKQTVLEREATFNRYMNAIRNRANIPFVTAFNTMIQYIYTRDDAETKKEFVDKYWMGWKDLFMNIQAENYSVFLEKTLNGFDVFGFGLTLIYVLSRLRKWMKPEVVKKMNELCFRMMTPNVFVRLSIEEVAAEYDKIIAAGLS